MGRRPEGSFPTLPGRKASIVRGFARYVAARDGQSQVPDQRRLLASTGLRVSEALSLQRADADLRHGILHIRQTKFRKSRLVPMHPTVTAALRRYAAWRDRDAIGASGTAFFVGRCGRALPYSTVRSTFRRLCAKLRWRSNGTLPRPRIHDLRHSFAVADSSNGRATACPSTKASPRSLPIWATAK